MPEQRGIAQETNPLFQMDRHNEGIHQGVRVVGYHDEWTLDPAVGIPLQAELAVENPKPYSEQKFQKVVCDSLRNTHGWRI